MYRLNHRTETPEFEALVEQRTPQLGVLVLYPTAYTVETVMIIIIIGPHVKTFSFPPLYGPKGDKQNGKKRKKEKKKN